jgi:serine/threonine protein phosphatase 1
MGRTFAIGDIHGDLGSLNTLLSRLPIIAADDTLVFLGDYVDRGPDSRGVVERVRALASQTPARVVALRGNHEDEWLEALAKPNPAFILPRGNGCFEMFRSFTGGPVPTREDSPTAEEFPILVEPRVWIPADVAAWMAALPFWYEDEHAIYVHAGLEGEGTVWKHPRESALKPLLWMREPDFYAGYRGKRIVFGHTPTNDLPLDHIPPGTPDDPNDVWMRGDLVAIDTGCGKGGFLSAVELPSMTVYESR